jgi:zinc protease
LEPSFLDESNGRIAVVTMEDCQRGAQRLLGAGELLVKVVGKPRGVRGLSGRKPSSQKL